MVVSAPGQRSESIIDLSVPQQTQFGLTESKGITINVSQEGSKGTRLYMSADSPYMAIYQAGDHDLSVYLATGYQHTLDQKLGQYVGQYSVDIGRTVYIVDQKDVQHVPWPGYNSFCTFKSARVAVINFIELSSQFCFVPPPSTASHITTSNSGGGYGDGGNPYSFPPSPQSMICDGGAQSVSGSMCQTLVPYGSNLPPPPSTIQIPISRNGGGMDVWRPNPLAERVQKLEDALRAQQGKVDTIETNVSKLQSEVSGISKTTEAILDLCTSTAADVKQTKEVNSELKRKFADIDSAHVKIDGFSELVKKFQATNDQLAVLMTSMTTPQAATFSSSSSSGGAP